MTGEGRLARTLRALFTQPGQLTIEHVEGRDSRYVAPWPLYVGVCVVYVALAWGPHALSHARRAFVGLSEPAPSVSLLSAEDRKLLLEEIADAPPALQSMIARAIENPTGLEADFSGASPKALFLLLPVFAGIVMLFYRTRPFTNHLIFAVHVHAFTFAALSVLLIGDFTHSSVVSFVLGLAALLGIPYYWHAALRRVYGGTRRSQLLKELGIGTLYALVSIALILAIAL